MDDDEAWREHYLVTRLITNPGERAALYRGAQQGHFACVVRGVYVTAAYWSSLDVEARHLARMRATELLHPGVVFSHLSAALAWGLPIVGARLTVPHSIVDAAHGGRSLNGLARHTLGIPDDVHVVGGLNLTSPADTIVHVAGSYPPETSVPVLDAALARSEWRLAPVELISAAVRLNSSAGPVRAEWALRFADPRSGSAGESLSRVTFWRLRLPAPQLQCRFDDRHGLIGIVDFFWSEFRVVGEFDGLGKYLRDEYRGGRSTAEVVLDEKRRENRLRAVDLRVARWEWADARSGSTLRRILLDAGVRAS